MQPIGHDDEVDSFIIQSKQYSPVPGAHSDLCSWFWKLFQFLFPTLVSIFLLVEVCFGHQNDVNSIGSSLRLICMTVRSIRWSLGIINGRTMCCCHESWVLKCCHINKIRFLLHEAIRTPPSQSSGIGLQLYRDSFIVYILLLDKKLRSF